jgi:hypothetical protein
VKAWLLGTIADKNSEVQVYVDSGEVILSMRNGPPLRFNASQAKLLATMVKLAAKAAAGPDTGSTSAQDRPPWMKIATEVRATRQLGSAADGVVIACGTLGVVEAFDPKAASYVFVRWKLPDGGSLGGSFRVHAGDLEASRR